MTPYSIRIEMKNGEVEEIMAELNNAQQKIYDCYRRLLDLGVVTISDAEESAPENQ